MASADPYAEPTLACDIVMKGGITSGVVYPGAVLALARKYRFKSIGGASAGGIAAAIVAAAEHARDDGGFERLAELPGELAQTTGDGRPFMLQLFQPDPETRPLFSVLTGFLEHGPVGALGVLRAFWRFPLLAFVVAAVSILLSAVAGADAAFAVAGVFAATVILVVGVIADILAAVKRLPGNDFGLCRLGPGAGTDQAPALTAWLHERIQTAAGRGAADPPLAFADLWAGPGAPLPPVDQPEERLERLLHLSRTPLDRTVDLQMMTTDLTHGRPLRLPVPYQQYEPIIEAGGGLFFDPEELERFFPEDVVKHLVDHASPTSDATAEYLGNQGASRMRHFPIGPDLPVVVATRMTLSFPILISAIPLYELDFRRPGPPPLVRVLFSDGGITSNFPVHFFDGPLPTRPTFGLNLTAFEPWEQPDRANPCAAVRSPAPVNQAAHQSIAQIDGLGGFLTAIKDAAQNWRDNAQAELPGFRDRVVHLKMAKGEGGLNLTMKTCKIEELNARGVCAGEKLVELFADDGTPKPKQWNDHRFVRYRTTMGLLERFLRSYSRGYDEPVDAATIPYAERVAAGNVAPYPFTAAALAFAQDTTEDYTEMVEDWGGQTLDDEGMPRPPSTLRAVPPA